MNRKLLFLVATIFVALVACSPTLRIAVINNTGQPATFDLAGESITVGSGETAHGDYPQSKFHHRLQLLAAGCRLSYQVPESLENYPPLPGFVGVVVTQLESDLKIYLVPRDSTTPVRISEVTSLQQDGFPLAPVARQCPANLALN